MSIERILAIPMLKKREATRTKAISAPFWSSPADEEWPERPLWPARGRCGLRGQGSDRVSV